jgi:hypothetical protein
VLLSETDPKRNPITHPTDETAGPNIYVRSEQIRNPLRYCIYGSRNFGILWVVNWPNGAIPDELEI